MPDYSTVAGFYDVLSEKKTAQLTDDAEGATPNEDIIESALDRAESVVDSYVGKQYDVPLDTPVPDSVLHAVLTLAKCYLYNRRPGAIPDETKEECETVMEWLKGVAAGSIEIVDLSPASNVADEDGDDEVFSVQVF